MMDIAQLTRGYLESEGYEVVQREKDLQVGTQRSLGEDLQVIYVWTPAVGGGGSFRAREGPYLARFKDANDVHPFAQKFMVVPSLEGFTAEFRKGALQWYNVKIRVPVQFFDTAFKWEQSPEAPSAARDLRTRGEALRHRRIAQPFTADDGREEGGDLLATLLDRLRKPTSERRTIHVVVGPAGIGKSYLFEALFAKLHEGFLDDKRRQILAARPLALLPQYLPMSDGPGVKALLRAYLQTDFARPLNAQVFEWMITNGLALWLLDGLDELITQDPDFFDYLLDLMTSPKAQAPPTILICIRDSLLATNNSLRDFCQDYSSQVRVYRLQPWREESKRQFARIALADSDADGFIRALAGKPKLDRIASTPYYCQLLADQFREGQLDESLSEVSLAHYALARIIAREYEKQLIDRLYIHEADLIDLIEALAVEDMEGGFQGVSVDEASSLAQIILPGAGETELTQPQLQTLTAQLTQLALFTSAGTGQLQFAQEILEHYLLGQWLCRLCDHGSDSLVRGLSVRQIPPDWITLHVLLDHIASEGRTESLVPLIYDAVGRGHAFKNAVQLVALVSGQPTLLKDVPFERQDLAGIVFSGLEFRGASFRGCDLTESEFRDCDMQAANLSDAVIRNTLIIPRKPDGLRDATVGDLGRFYSLRLDGGRVIDDHLQAAKWFEKQIGAPVAMAEPCVGALQLRHIFGKFVDPNGQPKRARLDRKGLLAGKQFSKPDEVLDASIRYGYLLADDFRGRIARVDGPAYSELITFVSDRKVSPGIRQLLSEVCDRKGCAHQL